MSLGGKISAFKHKLKSLLSKEQALSARKAAASFALCPERTKDLDAAVEKWIEGKGYRMPDPTVAQAAQRIGTTSKELYRYCRAQGMDFRTWRAMLRVEDAKEQLLAEPWTSANTIGRRVGFSDRSNFTRQFKALTGQTPDVWRKNQK